MYHKMFILSVSSSLYLRKREQKYNYLINISGVFHSFIYYSVRFLEETKNIGDKRKFLPPGITISSPHTQGQCYTPGIPSRKRWKNMKNKISGGGLDESNESRNLQSRKRPECRRDFHCVQVFPHM
uniref:SLC22A10 protein n=1 Tax=Fopius arisanus TaxID=64838 RepID=A0A0C9RLC7_9HYME